MQASTANGLEGYAPAQPYDRIIATGGYHGVPQAWNAQLTAGGVLIGNLLGALATPLYYLVKGTDGSMAGQLLSTPAFFMPLYPNASVSPPSIDFARFQTISSIELGNTNVDMVKLVYDPSFCLFLETVLPGVERRQRYLGGSSKNIGTCLVWKETLLTFAPLKPEGGIAALDWTCDQRGNVPLWSQVQSAYRQWRDNAKPPVDRYRFTISSEGTSSLQLDEV